MPEKILFILSTSRTGTKALAEGLAGGDIESPHQPPFSRILTLASNYYLHGWIPRSVLEKLIYRFREPQILLSPCRYYIQVFSLDYLPAKILSEKHQNISIIHIIRDPRTFVPSYLNWMQTRFKSFVANRLVPGWHPSGFFLGQFSFKEWSSMPMFQKVCWHWTYKNILLNNMFSGYPNYFQIQFEDLFSEKGESLLKGVLHKTGVPYKDSFNRIFTEKKNTSSIYKVPSWENWPEGDKKDLLRICGPQMKKYGYL